MICMYIALHIWCGYPTSCSIKIPPQIKHHHTTQITIPCNSKAAFCATNWFKRPKHQTAYPQWTDNITPPSGVLR